MKTSTEIPDLQEVLNNLAEKGNLHFEEVCDLLFTFDYADFDNVFNLSGLTVPQETCVQIPVLNNNFMAWLTVWGVKDYSVIRDHAHCDRQLKVLKGSLIEVSYRENSNFIEYDSRSVVRTGDLLAEEESDINSLINNSDDISVSLHIARCSTNDLGGVRIFDTQNRKIAYLSNTATLCSWNLPENAYQKIIQL